METQFKVGTVAIVGRPNVGKSTLLNELLEQRVAAVSARPQTTQAPIHAVYENEKGQIFFLDTPGLFKAKGGANLHNRHIAEIMDESDLVLYVVDHTRPWGHEEDAIWRLVQDSGKPGILVINKTDISGKSYTKEYLKHITLEQKIEISAVGRQHLQGLLLMVFEALPEGERNSTVDTFPTPLLSQTSATYVEELVREKVYQSTSQEVPYQTSVQIDDISEDKKLNRMTFTGRILVSSERYKPMLIGKGGQKIKQIGQAVRRDLETATNKHVVVKLEVMTRR